MMINTPTLCHILHLFLITKRSYPKGNFDSFHYNILLIIYYQNESAFWLASLTSSNQCRLSPESFTIYLASIDLFPLILITIGFSIFKSLTAFIIPSTTISHLTIPPKILISIDFTSWSSLIIEIAYLTASAFEPPPISKKLAGFPFE